MDTSQLQIFRREAPVSVLGPGSRAAIWVQGCSIGCKGCIIPESWSPTAGEAITVSKLAAWVLSQDGIEGITLSGGEPMSQAGPLAKLIDFVRAQADYGVVCYTGYRFESLSAKGTPEQCRLLERIDLLIDGPYSESLHANRLWRGSSNQRLILLTERYRGAVDQRLQEGDISAGIEAFFHEDGMHIVGVPSIPQFRQVISTSMLQEGVILEPKEREA